MRGYPSRSFFETLPYFLAHLLAILRCIEFGDEDAVLRAWARLVKGLQPRQLQLVKQLWN
jgi:hypothetical protein